MQAHATQPSVATTAETVETPRVRLAALAGLLAIVSVALALTVESEVARLQILRGFLLLLAAAEGFFGVTQLFRPRQFDSDPPGIYLRQHVGLYNLFAVLLYLFAAFDPLKNVVVVQAAIALYVAHAGYELCCYLGLAPPGRAAFRPKRTYLVDGATLLAVILPVVVFYP